MDNKISIVLSTYNEAPFIEQTIAEILKNIKNVEIILVDDSSTNGTFEKVKKKRLMIFQKVGKNIRKR